MNQKLNLSCGTCKASYHEVSSPDALEKSPEVRDFVRHHQDHGGFEILLEPSSAQNAA